jgi:hypothetical protein
MVCTFLVLEVHKDLFQPFFVMSIRPVHTNIGKLFLTGFAFEPIWNVGIFSGLKGFPAMVAQDPADLVNRHRARLAMGSSFFYIQVLSTDMAPDALGINEVFSRL